MAEAPPGDALRRTRLANERTFLAWLRTGVTCLAAGLAIGRILPELIGEDATWAYAAIGAGWATVGMALIGYGLRRERAVAAAVERGEYAPVEGVALVALTGVAFLLGAGTLALVVLQA
jgi:putative membrane protein